MSKRSKTLAKKSVNIEAGEMELFSLQVQPDTVRMCVKNGKATVGRSGLKVMFSEAEMGT